VRFDYERNNRAFNAACSAANNVFTRQDIPEDGLYLLQRVFRMHSASQKYLLEYGTGLRVTFDEIWRNVATTACRNNAETALYRIRIRAYPYRFIIKILYD
jgi:hypothetical protein